MNTELSGCMWRVHILTIVLWASLAPAVDNSRRDGGSLDANYDKFARPVQHANLSVDVTFTLKVLRVVDLDEKNQILRLAVVITESWTDRRLEWNSVQKTDHWRMLEARQIWHPDIYIYNNAAAENFGFVYSNDSRVLVDQSGLIIWHVPMDIHSSCSVDILYFPFDHQFCEVRFGSWTHDIRQLRLRIPRNVSIVDKHGMVRNSELKVRGMRIMRTNTTSSGMIYQLISLRIHIQRKALYYSYTVIAPSIMLSVLTLFSFWLPCNVGEKIGIGLTVFLFLYFLELVIAENTPESNSTPLIGIFLTLVMTLNSISLIMATLVLHVRSQADKEFCSPVPRWLWRFSRRILGRLTFTKLEIKKAHAQKDDLSESESEVERSENDLVSQRWIYVAEVIDKFLFEFYLCCTILSITIVLYVLPSNYENAFNDDSLWHR